MYQLTRQGTSVALCFARPNGDAGADIVARRAQDRSLLFLSDATLPSKPLYSISSGWSAFHFTAVPATQFLHARIEPKYTCQAIGRELQSRLQSTLLFCGTQNKKQQIK